MEHFERNKAKSFARAIKTWAANPQSAFAAQRAVERKYGADSPELEIITRAAVAPALTTTANWAGSIAATSGNAFVGAAAAIGVFGKLTQAPANLSATGLTTGASASFVAEGGATPLNQMVLASTALPPKSVVATLAISQELANLSDPRADAIFERELRKALVNAIDGALLSTSAGSSSTPAGIFNAVTAVNATSDATADIRDLVDDFTGDLTSAFFVGDPKTTASLSDPSRPLVGIRNGEILNAPAYVSRNCPSGVLALVDADGVFFASGDIDASVSSEASAIMSDAPSSPAASVNFWQSNLVGIRLSLNLDWLAVRPGSVSFISGAAW